MGLALVKPSQETKNHRGQGKSIEPDPRSNAPNYENTAHTPSAKMTPSTPPKKKGDSDVHLLL